MEEREVGKRVDPVMEFGGILGSLCLHTGVDGDEVEMLVIL